jgi:hypothetical protein
MWALDAFPLQVRQSSLRTVVVNGNEGITAMTDPTDRFAIIPVTHGPAPPDAIAVGSMSAVMEHLPDTIARQDAINRLDEGMAKAAEVAQLQSMARACNVIAFADSIDRLTGRLDAFTARRDAQRRADAAREAEEEAKRIQAELDALPDPDDPNPFSGKSEKPEPSLEVEDDGELPEALAKYSEAPEPEPEEPPWPPKNYVAQPIAVQLNSDEE